MRAREIMAMTLREKIARQLWDCEAKRARHCEGVLSAAKGKPITDTMEPFEEHRDMWLGDADAVVEVMRKPSKEMLHAGAVALVNAQSHNGVHQLAVFPVFEVWDAMIAAAISAAKEQT